MEGPTMDWKNDEYPSDEGGGGKMDWIWSNGVSLGKKFLAAGVVLASAPFIVPPLVVVSTFVIISSVPYCLFLASYACTVKLMKTLLPPPGYDGGNEETGGIEKDEYGFEEDVMEDNKHGHVDVDGEGITAVDEAEPVIEPSHGEARPVLIQIEEEDVTVTNRGEEPTIKATGRAVVSEEEEETKNMIESDRDEGQTDEVHGRTLEKAFQEDENPVVSRDVESENTKVEDMAEKTEGHAARNAGEKSEGDKQKPDGHEGKDEETTPNEPLDQAVDSSCGAGEEKRKNSSKKKKKTGRSGGVQ